jgi:hypothetical protein
MSKHKKPQPEHDLKKMGDPVTPSPPTRGEDVNVRMIVRFAMGLFGAVGLVAALVFVFMEVLGRYEARQDPTRPPMGVPRREEGDPDNEGVKALLPDGGVRLQRDPFGLREQQKKDEDEILNGDPTFIDEKAGAVRIKIARAMELLVHRGLPVRSASGAVPAAAVTPSPTVAAPRPSPTRSMPRPKPAARPRPRAEKEKAKEKPAAEAPAAEAALPAPEGR